MIGRAAAGLAAAAALIAVLTPPRVAETPAPPEPEIVTGAPLGCFREGRFLELNPALCAEVFGVPRPRGETAEETPSPRPTLRLTVEPL